MSKKIEEKKIHKALANVQVKNKTERNEEKDQGHERKEKKHNVNI